MQRYYKLDTIRRVVESYAGVLRLTVHPNNAAIWDEKYIHATLLSTSDGRWRFRERTSTTLREVMRHIVPTRITERGYVVRTLRGQCGALTMIHYAPKAWAWVELPREHWPIAIESLRGWHGIIWDVIEDLKHE